MWLHGNRLQTQQGTSERSETVTACSRPAPARVEQNPSVEKGREHKVHLYRNTPTTKKIFAIDTCRERKLCFLLMSGAQWLSLSTLQGRPHEPERLVNTKGTHGFCLLVLFCLAAFCLIGFLFCFHFWCCSFVCFDFLLFFSFCEREEEGKERENL